MHDRPFPDLPGRRQNACLLLRGGARSKFYQDAFLYKHKNISWLRPERIIESDAISDLQETMTTPIRREDYDRLLVAYGLVPRKR